MIWADSDRAQRHSGQRRSTRRTVCQRVIATTRGHTARQWVSLKKGRGFGFGKYCFRCEKATKDESAPREDENQPKIEVPPKMRVLSHEAANNRSDNCDGYCGMREVNEVTHESKSHLSYLVLGRAQSRRWRKRRHGREDSICRK